MKLNLKSTENLQKTVIGLKKYIKSKNLDADIIVVQQNKFGNWNKGCTCNVGFNILKDHYDYFVFNDADTYPEENTPFVFPKENDKPRGVGGRPPPGRSIGI